jgi:EAL domain-containing protein (putative c-di-GMP-specific phosphodiesterase class I)
VPPVPQPPVPGARPTTADLAAAIARGDIRTRFQPKVALATGALIGVEALARWTHAELGPVPPDRFIPLAEDSGLIGRLTLSVLRDALRAVAILRRHHPEATVAVNISPVLLDDPALPDKIAALLEAAGLPPSVLVAEITEGQPFTNPARAAAVLAALRERGVGCAMDDFGTGFATLPALLRMPFTELKIDRSFVSRSADLPEARKLVRATIRLAQALGLRVVAEGVESAAVETLLREAGCDVGQGFRYGRAMPVECVLARWPGTEEG